MLARAGPIAVNAVERMSVLDRFKEVCRALPYMPDAAKDQFVQLLSPSSLEIMAGMFVIWAGSHAVGVGEAGDLILLGMGIGFLGMQALTAGKHLLLMIQLTVDARTEDDLDQAAGISRRSSRSPVSPPCSIWFTRERRKPLPASATPSAARSPIPASAASRCTF